jgi:two-component system NarL family response regulator
MSIRVLLADDHAVFREALVHVLAHEADIIIAGQAGSGREAVELCRDLMPDVAVLDISMPDLNGVGATAHIVARNPAVKVIALSAYSDRRFVSEMLKAGAVGYVTKSSAGTELLRAIRAVCKGQNYICPEIAATLVSAVTELGGAGTVKTGINLLGRREREVLQLIAEGLRGPDLAKRLNIAESTVEVHRRNIMRKLDLHTVADLTRFAIREGLSPL